jgi:single-stranded-DNA-specific exonuclease
MVQSCCWRIRQINGQPEPAEIGNWARELNISSFLARLLWRRGLTDPHGMEVFLGPNLRHLPPIDQWPELDRAADILAEELERGEPLAVWGDYDADGVTATALVLHFLRRRGYQATPYIPHRLTEGYGLNFEGLEQLAASGAECLLTVDCGISDVEGVERARELGMSVVVSDHHQAGETLPGARAVVNPKLGNGVYSEAAGVGVAFLLMAALNRKLPGGPLDMRDYLDLVALGTVADVVELTEENRILVKNGLLLLEEAKRPGIFALKEASGLPATAPVGSGQVGFSLGPRINAAGRMGDPSTALELLLAEDLDTARELAQTLEQHNQKRRSQEDAILERALEQAEQWKDSPGLVLYDPEWHEGIIGIVASRVRERYYRPTILLSRDGDQLTGSGRSIEEFDLFSGLCDCRETLVRFGGHPQAAGLSLREGDLDAFRESFSRAVRRQVGESLPEPSLYLEAELGLDRVDLTLVKELELLQPFGAGNPEPLFCSKPLRVQRHKVFKESHVSLELRDEQAARTMQGKAWRQAGTLGPEVSGKNVRLAFTPRLNTYNGLVSIDLQIRDCRLLSNKS